MESKERFHRRNSTRPMSKTSFILHHLGIRGLCDFPLVTRTGIRVFSFSALNHSRFRIRPAATTNAIPKISELMIIPTAITTAASSISPTISRHSHFYSALVRFGIPAFSHISIKLVLVYFPTQEGIRASACTDFRYL